MKYAPYLLVGFASLILQTVFVRELLSVFSGNELDIGITLSVWLISIGAGSLLGRKIKAKNAFALSFLFISLLMLPSLASVYLVRPALGVAHGEVISLSATFIGTLIVMSPVCIMLGMQFPLAASRIGGSMPASRVYGLEAIGALIGGAAFTLFLAPIKPELLVLSLTLAYVSMSAVIYGKRAVLLFFVAPVLFYQFAGDIRSVQYGHLNISETDRSKYGEILVAVSNGQKDLFYSGHYLYSYPSQRSDEISVHMQMSLHPMPRDVLIIGGAPGRILEFLKYPFVHIDYAETDPLLIEKSISMLQSEDAAIIAPPRVNIISKDGRCHVKSLSGPTYDLVSINLSEPSTANLNRFYTLEFFKELKTALNAGGIVVLGMHQSAGYVGRRMLLANGSVLNSLSSVFLRTGASSEEYGMFYASDNAVDASAQTLAERFIERNIEVNQFYPYLFQDAFDQLRSVAYMQRLHSVDALNTDMRPAAYLYNLSAWADIHGARLLNAMLSNRHISLACYLLLYIAAFFSLRKSRQGAVYFSVLTSGAMGMAVSVSVVLAFQSQYGFVFEMFGLLSALFMAGAGLGSLVVRGGSMRHLIYADAGMAAFAVTASLTLTLPIALYAISFIAGALSGMNFALASLGLKNDSSAGHGGMMYFADLAGSFAAALSSSIILIPLYGMRTTILIAGAIKLMSLSALVMARAKNE